MNEIDYAVFALLIISLVIGVYRGAVREVVNIAGWLLAFILAHAYAADVAAWFADWATEPAVKAVAAWLAIFLVVLIVMSLLASLASEFVKKLGLGTLDRALGAGIGLARGALIVLGLTLAAGLTKLPQSPLWRGAMTTPWLEVMAQYARGVLPDAIASRIKYRHSALQST